MVTAVSPFPPDGYGSSRTGNGKMGGENPESLSYKGHGRIERYPKNLNIAYVTGHERGHANSNRLEALAKNETVEQNISYKLTLTKEGMVAEGVTKRTRNIAASSGSLKKFEAYSSALSTAKNSSELNISGILLKNELARLKSEQLNSGFSSQQGNDVAKQKNEAFRGNPEALKGLIGIKEAGLKGNSNQGDIFVRIKELEAKLTTGAVKKVNVSNIKDDNTTALKSGGGYKEEHIDLTRGAELALQSHTSSVTGLPPLEGVGYGSSFGYQGVINTITNSTSNGVVKNQQQTDPNRLRAKSGFWSVLKNKLANLQAATSNLSSLANYSNNQTSSYSSSFVEFKTDVQTSKATYQVDISQIAKYQKVQSDVYSNTGSALGLSGTFYVNGASINVSVSDSINSIRDAINWGEDRNKNNVLEYSEDVNGDGILQNYVAGGQNGSSVYIVEDGNYNGVNDGTEDLNGNNRLDGGTKDHGVLAAIQNNRLTLTYQGSSNLSSIYFSGGEESNSLLTSLGILQQNLLDTGNESSLFQYSIKNETVAQNAIFSVNGTSYTRNSNQISDVISNATMTLKAPTDVTQTVRIRANSDAAENYIQEFIGSFNDAVRFMNDSLMQGNGNSGLMRGDRDLIRVRKDVIDSVHGGNSPDNKIIHMMQSIGITPSKGSQRAISFLAAKNLANNLSQTSSRGNGVPSSSVGTNGTGGIPVGNYSNFAALSTARVGSTEDYTLNYDSSKLGNAIKESPQRVYDVFNNSAVGSVPLVTSRLDSILNPQSGLIANKERIAQVKIQRNQMSSSSKENQYSLEASQRQKSFTRNYLSQYQAYSVGTSLGALSVKA